MVLRFCIVIVCITTSASIASFLLINLLADIIIIDKIVGYSKYNEPSFLLV
jgi:hypothetical protein